MEFIQGVMLGVFLGYTIRAMLVIILRECSNPEHKAGNHG